MLMMVINGAWQHNLLPIVSQYTALQSTWATEGTQGLSWEQETGRVEGQTSGDITDPEVGISSIREALSDQDAGFDSTYSVCV